MMGLPAGDASPRLPRPREVLPLFTLPNTCGQTVRLWDFKQRRPVVLLFIHGAACASCRSALARLARRHADLREAHAAVLVIAPESLEPLSRLREELNLPFTCLADGDGAVSARYLGAARASRPVGLYVADRYGECGLAATAAEATELPEPDAILAELAYADEETCSCLVPAWADVSV